MERMRPREDSTMSMLFDSKKFNKYMQIPSLMISSWRLPQSGKTEATASISKERISDEIKSSVRELDKTCKNSSLFRICLSGHGFCAERCISDLAKFSMAFVSVELKISIAAGMSTRCFSKSSSSFARLPKEELWLIM